MVRPYTFVDCLIILIINIPMLSLTRGELGGTKCARVKAGVTVRRVIVKIEVTLVSDRYATTYMP